MTPTALTEIIACQDMHRYHAIEAQFFLSHVTTDPDLTYRVYAKHRAVFHQSQSAKYYRLISAIRKET